MDNIKEITTSKFTGLAVLVPGNSFNYVVRENEEQSDLWYESHYGDDDISNWIELPLAKHQFIARWPEITESQAAEIVDEAGFFDFGHGKYKSYSEKDKSVMFTTESFASLMQSIGCEQGKQYVILKKL